MSENKENVKLNVEEDIVQYHFLFVNVVRTRDGKFHYDVTGMPVFFHYRR